MKIETQLELISWLEQAMECEHGLELQFATADEAKLFRAKLYTARKDIPAYESMAFVQRSNCLWILKGESDVGTT